MLILRMNCWSRFWWWRGTRVEGISSVQTEGRSTGTWCLSLSLVRKFGGQWSTQTPIFFCEAFLCNIILAFKSERIQISHISLSLGNEKIEFFGTVPFFLSELYQVLQPTTLHFMPMSCPETWRLKLNKTKKSSWLNLTLGYIISNSLTINTAE